MVSTLTQTHTECVLQWCVNVSAAAVLTTMTMTAAVCVSLCLPVSSLLPLLIKVEGVSHTHAYVRKTHTHTKRRHRKHICIDSAYPPHCCIHFYKPQCRGVISSLLPYTSKNTVNTLIDCSFFVNRKYRQPLQAWLNISLMTIIVTLILISFKRTMYTVF